jgi:UPF0755 protein
VSLRLTLTLVAVGSALALTIGALAYRALEPLAPGSEETTQLFLIEPGQGLALVARNLEREGLIKHARVLSLLGRISGDAGNLGVGEYEISAGWTPRTILNRITSGRVKTYQVVLPEGIRATEIAARLQGAGLADAEDFMATVHDPVFARSLGIEQDSLEGYLYPETYRLSRHLTSQEIARVFVAQFEQVWREVESIAEQQSLSQHEIVTLASIIEKETAAPEERPLIAAVFHNRLKKRMRLETDPTVIYGIDEFDGNLTRAHLRGRSNPYNTYRIAGLPPGPIASPGIDALRAALEPAETDYYYFVSRNDGTHKFSRTYREHNEAVRKYQLRRRSR